MTSLKRWLAGASCALVAGPAAADPRDWSSSHFDVTASDKSCVLTSTYSFEGRSDVEIAILYDTTSAYLFITSYDWSAEENANYDGFGFHFFQPDASYGGATQGFRDDGYRKGFMVMFDAEFLDAFGAARRFVVARTVEPDAAPSVVTDLNLVGSGAAITALKRCARIVADQKAAQERREARNNYIARDPFAPVPSEPGGQPVPAPVRWALGPQAEFPERAQSRGIRTGAVQLACDVGASGAATGCAIVSETPEGAGFGQSALRSMTRARFAPGVTGRPTFTVRFELADSTTPEPSAD